MNSQQQDKNYMDPFHVICISKQALYLLSSFLLMKLYIQDNVPFRKLQGSDMRRCFITNKVK